MKGRHSARATRPIGGGRGARISLFRRFPIRRKLAITLAVPMLGLLVIGMLNVYQAREEAQTATEQAELARAAAGVEGLQAMLQQEYALTAMEVYDLEPRGFEADSLGAARAMTDEALGDFAATVEGQNSAVREAYQPTLDLIAGDDADFPGLTGLRQHVDESIEESDLEGADLNDELAVLYDVVLAQISQANRETASQVEDLDLRRGVALVGIVTDQRNTLAKVVQSMSRMARPPGEEDDPDTYATQQVARAVSAYSEMQANDRLILAEGRGPYEPLVDDLYASPYHEELAGMVETTLATGDSTAVLGKLVGETTVLGDLGDDSYRIFGADVATELQSRADSVASDARGRQNTYVLFGLAALLLTGVVTWAMSRVLIGALKSLAYQADVMGQQLPTAVRGVVETPLGEDVRVPELAPIEVSSRDEIADVASTLNDAQDSTVRLAVEQAALRRNVADSLLGLGRRTQGLLDRHIDLITTMESDETDPDALAKLFSLDHLATRMRRNAESLLVLGGAAPPRRWSQPVPVSDVVRAALGEVEGYQRVLIQTMGPGAVAGSAAADVTHLLAELIENALTFSLPRSPVEIEGSPQPEGYQVRVIDLGWGMPPEDLDRSNRRLAGVESFTVAPSRYLGHYVAGHLATRHGIHVGLQPTSDRPPALAGHPGITAVIHLPQNLLAPAASPRELADRSSPKPSTGYRQPSPPSGRATTDGSQPRPPHREDPRNHDSDRSNARQDSA